MEQQKQQSKNKCYEEIDICPHSFRHLSMKKVCIDGRKGLINKLYNNLLS